MPSDFDDLVLNEIALVLGVDRRSLDLETPLETMADWDSLRHMQAVLRLEDRFGISFSEEDVRNGWNDLQDLVQSTRNLVNSDER